MSSCMRCNNCAEECSELCPQCLSVDAAHEAEIEAAIAKERADMRSWLGRKAVEAERESRGVGDRAIVCAGKRSAFKEAADHLKPPKVKGHLKRKRAARAVGK